MSHQEISSKDDFDQAIKASDGKFVFVLAYEGAPPPNADE